MKKLTKPSYKYHTNHCHGHIPSFLQITCAQVVSVSENSSFELHVGFKARLGGVIGMMAGQNGCRRLQSYCWVLVLAQSCFTEDLCVNSNIHTLKNRNGSWRIELLRKGFWGRGTGCWVTVSLMLCVSTYTYIFKHVVKIGWANIHENNRPL